MPKAPTSGKPESLVVAATAQKKQNDPVILLAFSSIFYFSLAI